MTTKSELEKRYEFLTSYLVAQGLLVCHSKGNNWKLKDMQASGIFSEGSSMDETIDKGVLKLAEIREKWLGPPDRVEANLNKLVEQNESTALLVDSLVSGTQG